VTILLMVGESSTIKMLLIRGSRLTLPV